MILNGKEYKIPEITFDMVCELEDAGISLSDIGKPKKKAMSIVRAFVKLATGLENEQVSDLIEDHLVNGGNFEGIFDEINKALTDSRFFQKMAERAITEEKAETKAKTKAK
ncbi:MAG: hypothetical protein E6600_04305 [Anaerocolumna aminovalerica]|uniref:hypothetical protein n=1 Tax=Anaerocolumna aminovalerica TaxID=1527 RepID=UPI002914CD1D|nr:hypothetical protein [Anaerocolumna aminovalerica]MDU6263708.1 hypothetical protein [Anaerocolumna aminovalerica]